MAKGAAYKFIVMVKDEVSDADSVNIAEFLRGQMRAFGDSVAKELVKKFGAAGPKLILAPASLDSNDEKLMEAWLVEHLAQVAAAELSAEERRHMN